MTASTAPRWLTAVVVMIGVVTAAGCGSRVPSNAVPDDTSNAPTQPAAPSTSGAKGPI